MHALHRFLARILVLSAVAFAFAARGGRTESLQQRRLALVVGNGAYPTAPLKNPSNDARGVADALRGAQFEVTLIIDADLKTLTKAVQRFTESIDPGDVALFYYSGHGIQIEGENYLQPIDFNAQTLMDVKYEAYSAQRVQELMEGYGAKLTILILDACRDNPFRALRSARKGLAPMSGGRGTFIAFATGFGGTASDNPRENNGLFTKYLIDALKRPGLKIDDVFNQVRSEVYKASNQHQLPWTTSSVIGDFYFVPPQAALLSLDKPQVPHTAEALATAAKPPAVLSHSTEPTSARVQPPLSSSPAPARGKLSAADANSQLNKAKDDLLTALDTKVMPVINATGSANRMALIFRKFEAGLIYTDDRFDITKPIIDQLDAGTERGVSLTLPSAASVAVVDIGALVARSQTIKEALRRIGKSPSDWPKIDPKQLEEIDAVVMPAIRAVGVANRITYVFKKFEAGLIFADDAVDITNTVIQQLDNGTAPVLQLPQGAIATGVVDTEHILLESKMGKDAIQKLKKLQEDLTARVKQ
jgi:uncharacterized caspase-like protein